MSYELSWEQAQASAKFHANAFHGIAWWKAGEGKTRLALHSWWSLRNECKHLIVVTRRKVFYDWENEALNKMELAAVIRTSTTVTAADFAPEAPPMILLLSGHERDIRKLDRKVPSLPLWNAVLVIDELYMYGNDRSARSKAVHWLQRLTIGTIGLSATIMSAQDVRMIWGQARAIGLCESLAENKSDFVERYMMPLSLPYMPEGAKKWVTKPAAKGLIMKRLEPYVHLHYPTNDKRTIHHAILPVEPTKEQRKEIEYIKENWEFNGLEYEHAPQILHAVSGMSNGWWKSPDGGIEHYESAKVDRLVALVEELWASGAKQLLVWCHYRADVDRLRIEFPSERVFTFRSGDEFNLNQWNRGAGHRVCLATMSSGASVNHFEQVQYAIYFSQNYKWVDLQQSMGRTDRKSSKHNEPYYYYLHTRGSFDQDIHETVRESADGEQAIIKRLAYIIGRSPRSNEHQADCNETR